MTFMTGCFLFLDGAFAILFFLLFDWLDLTTFAIVGAAIIAIPIWRWLIRNAIKEERKHKRKKAWHEIERIELARDNQELQTELKRRNSLCFFQDGVSQDEFETIAKNVAKRIKRLHVSVSGPVINCEVDSQSGISTWVFILDFNDFGHITGSYWITRRDNDDSKIPDRYADLMQEALKTILETTDS